MRHHVEAAQQARGVNGDNYQVGAVLLGGVNDQITGELLVRAHGIQRVGAGEVDDVIGNVLGLFPSAAAHLDGGAWPVAHAGFCAGEAVEKRGFAGIGCADECHNGGALGGHGMPMRFAMACCCFRGRGCCHDGPYSFCSFTT